MSVAELARCFSDSFLADKSASLGCQRGKRGIGKWFWYLQSCSGTHSEVLSAQEWRWGNDQGEKVRDYR